MTNPFFQMGAAFAALVMFSFFALEGGKVTDTLGSISSELGIDLGIGKGGSPVMVFPLADQDRLDNVRAAISSDRILWEDENGIAVAGQRLYVVDLAEAGELISEVGWVEHPIQIVGVDMADDEKDYDESEYSDEEDGDGPPKMSREAKMKKLQSLVNKPTLTRGEQIFVLRAMNEGVQL